MTGDATWDEIAAFLRSLQAPLRILDLQGVLCNCESTPNKEPQNTEDQTKDEVPRGIGLVDACLEPKRFKLLETVQVVLMDKNSEFYFSTRGVSYLRPLRNAKCSVELDPESPEEALIKMLPKLRARGVRVVVDIDETCVQPSSDRLTICC